MQVDGSTRTITEARWMGTPISKLTKEQLLVVVEHLGKELQEVRKDRERWMKAASPTRYLLQKRG